ncbi:MAG: MaoC family dehydratase, partial [Candidatus Helarchaeota archaeon]
YWDELTVGDRTSLHVKVTRKMILLYAMLSNDYNPIHVNLDYGKRTFFKTNIAHGIFVLSFASGVVGSRLFGEGVALMSINNATFKSAVTIDSQIIVTSEICKKYSTEIKGTPRYFVDVKISIYHEKTGKIAAEGTATIMVFNKTRS